MSGDEGPSNPDLYISSNRRKMAQLVDDVREIRDQGKKAILDPAQITLFKGMHLSLSTSYERFETIYDEVCDMCDERNQPIALPGDHDLRAKMRRYFHEINSMWNTVNETGSRFSASPSMVTWGGSRAKTKLPTLDLPKFGGERTKWPRFKDTFSSLVIDDPDLADIDRLHYLIRSLQGNAAAVIAHVPVSGAHFRVAWDALIQAYDNPRLLAATYLDQLLDLKAIHQNPSAEVMGHILATLSEISSAFNLLNIPDKADFMMFHIARRCLDSKTREDFERQNTVAYPTFNSLLEYLRSRCTAAELATGLSRLTLAQDISPGRQLTPRSYKRPTGPRLALVSSGPNSSKFRAEGYSHGPRQKCYICGSPHGLTNCLKFASASFSDRLVMLRTWRGCRNCLQTGHGTAKCPSTYRCRFCKGKHHSMLHPPSPKASCDVQTCSTERASLGSTLEPSPNHSSSPNQSSSSLNSVQRGQIEIMLGTAVCFIEDSYGWKHEIRLVIDSGSHFSFISRAFAERLGLSIDHHNADVWGIGETPLPGFKGRTTCTLSPISNTHLRLSTRAIVLDVITSSLPGFTTPRNLWKPYLSYPLADPEFWVTRPIDLLIGCDLFSEIMTGEIITLSTSLPRLLGTIFGYTVLGRVKDISAASSLACLHASPSSNADALDAEIRRFWELEEPPIVRTRDPADEICEEWFKKTTYRLPCGRYVVRLPFRTPEPCLPNSRGMAMRRLSQLEGKLERNPVLRTKYREFMSDYIALGHMEITSQPGKNFIPHHCVVKGEGQDIKVRVVFDAAAKTAAGSLNDVMFTGPKLQTNISLILLNFRRHAVVFTADAVKMYRQILVHPEDRAYQHVLWRSCPSEAVTEFELNTVSYGQSCAPYLALRVLQQLIMDEGQAYPQAALALRDDTYVDDIATGADSVEHALELMHQIVNLMQKGGFTLSKWASNHPEILGACQRIDPQTVYESGEGIPLEFSWDHPHVKILGMQWNPSQDCFYYRITVPEVTHTKRAVLSAVAKIYDPLGYLGPVVVSAKRLIQDAWKRRLGWDETFPTDLKEKWLSFIKDLPDLRSIKIPRWAVAPHGPYHILVFADASEEAYCAAVYLRSITPTGPQIHLIIAKTKLAPVKFTTVPRLELCAALLAAKIWQSLDPFVKRLSAVPEVSFFSDSTVVLTWLKTPYHLLKTFVANRVVQIRDLTSAGEWRHVSSADNPSDLGSRGISAQELSKSTLWFCGPPWAKSDPSEWPVSVVVCSPHTPELKASKVQRALVAVKSDLPDLVEWMNRLSSYSKLIRSLAYALRFIKRIKGNSVQPTIMLSLSEIRRATILAVRLVQGKTFFPNNLPPVTASIPKYLLSLNPFLSEDGVLMVGGRLQHSDLPWSAKHPMILPSKAHLSRLIVEHHHKALLHPGVSLLLAALRSKFWILGARNLIKSCNKACITCQRYDSKPAQPMMGDLPVSCFASGRAFVHVGIDFAGPFMVRESLRRKAPCSKAYLCLMVCLSTRALHLEVVSSLSTPAFLAALDRFIGRRGIPSQILSDNGTNFVGAAHHLRELYTWYSQEAVRGIVQNYALEKEIEWKFIPPHAPHFGGIWEAGVKSAKRLLRSVYGDNCMTMEELATFFIKIEAILNSRPLCPLSSDPQDLDYLSPGHFLIGTPLLAVPEPSLMDINENRLSRWQLVIQKTDHFWRRWRSEYLNTLQIRSKWVSETPNLQVGDLVLLREDGAPRMHWPVGRITEVFPGVDDVVRVANVKTTNSTLRRPVTKLIPLLKQ